MLRNIIRNLIVHPNNLGNLFSEHFISLNMLYNFKHYMYKVKFYEKPNFHNFL